MFVLGQEFSMLTSIAWLSLFGNVKLRVMFYIPAWRCAAGQLQQPKHSAVKFWFRGARFYNDTFCVLAVSGPDCKGGCKNGVQMHIHSSLRGPVCC